MLIGVLLLMLGTLAAEVSLFGLKVAALAGAVLLGLSALSFVVVAIRRRRAKAAAPSAGATSRPRAVGAPTPSLSR